MREKLPLFPLGTVLYPGLLLPLHIFEERYRQLMRDLLERPQPRRFGVIAIRKGRETGVDGVSALYEVGCLATVRQVVQHTDGTFDIVVVGASRFRLQALDDSWAYLRGLVELLPEQTGDEAVAAHAVPAVQRAFRGYLTALDARGLTQEGPDELPEEPGLLSYLVAATMVIDLPNRQALLAEPDHGQRLEAERKLLSRETAMLRALTSTPAPDLKYTPPSPN
jgi:Lon protease-like protein